MVDQENRESEIRWEKLLVWLAIYAVSIAVVFGAGAVVAESLTAIIVIPLVLAAVGMFLVYLQSHHSLLNEKTRDSVKALLKVEIEFYGVLAFIGGAGLVIFNAHDLAQTAANVKHDATEAKWEYLVTAAGLLGFSAIAAGKKLAIALIDLDAIRAKEKKAREEKKVEQPEENTSSAKPNTEKV